MAKVNMIAAQPYKGRAVGEGFTTSLKNSRTLADTGIATVADAKPVRKVAAKKTAARKAPAKKAASKTYRTRAMKAKK